MCRHADGRGEWAPPPRLRGPMRTGRCGVSTEQIVRAVTRARGRPVPVGRERTIEPTTWCTRFGVNYGRRPAAPVGPSAAKPPPRIIWRNSWKSTRPSPSRSTWPIMRRHSSAVRPCFSPSDASTAPSSSTVMYPSPFASNTRNASLMSSSSSTPSSPPFFSSSSPPPVDMMARSPNSSSSTHPSPSASMRAIMAASSSPGTGMPSFPRQSSSSSRVMRPSPFRSSSWNTRESSAASALPFVVVVVPDGGDILLGLGGAGGADGGGEDASTQPRAGRMEEMLPSCRETDSEREKRKRKAKKPTGQPKPRGEHGPLNIHGGTVGCGSRSSTVAGELAVRSGIDGA
ncbi:LOW QUALITY PROTEIN: hypothetical protein BRADI_5g14298v3 [Brachypodium distachyon]|uniref:Uncharacterized protein n=1 Tax=Brachypodium distachyon TaxID=15368 RepID=A0A2K2CH64_BRADI|nr:LOW QUALITY PROTEIN: hypothetical protein BRADI_5g14298v3 [Brachypodium distachyon]